QPLVDDPRRDMAGPESGDPGLPAHLAIRLVEAGLQLLEGNLDGQLHPGRAELLDIGLHGGVTPWLPARWSPARHVVGRGGAVGQMLWPAARRPGGAVPATRLAATAAKSRAAGAPA